MDILLLNGFTFFPAPGTQTPELDKVIVYIKAVFSGGSRNFQAVQVFGFKINQHGAIQTDEVMVPVRVGIVATGGAGIEDFVHETKINQKLQNPVDRHPGNSGKHLFYILEHFVRRGMIHSVQEHFIGFPALDSKRDPCLATSALKHMNFFIYQLFTHTS